MLEQRLYLDPLGSFECSQVVKRVVVASGFCVFGFDLGALDFYSQALKLPVIQQTTPTLALNYEVGTYFGLVGVPGKYISLHLLACRGP